MAGAITCFILSLFFFGLLGVPTDATLLISAIAAIGVYVVNRNDKD
jgi:hypothetical protein